MWSIRSLEGTKRDFVLRSVVHVFFLVGVVRLAVMFVSLIALGVTYKCVDGGAPSCTQSLTTTLNVLTIVTSLLALLLSIHLISKLKIQSQAIVALVLWVFIPPTLFSVVGFLALSFMQAALLGAATAGVVFLAVYYARTSSAKMRRILKNALWVAIAVMAAAAVTLTYVVSTWH